MAKFNHNLQRNLNNESKKMLFKVILKNNAII